MELKAGYKQTEVGVIPEDWETKTADQIATIKTGPFGTLLKASEYAVSDGVPLISVGEIRHGYIRVSDETPRVPKEVTKRLPQYVLKFGDIVFGRKGGVDRSALINKNQDGFFLGSDGISARPMQENDPKYLAFQFQSKRIQSWLLHNAIGTTMASLNQGIISKAIIPTPRNKAEQQAIASALSDADELIESLEQLLAKKRNLKQGAMQELLTGKRRLAGFVKPWRNTTIGQVVDSFLGGGTPSRSNPEYWGGLIPWMTVKDFSSHHHDGTQEKITEQGLRESSSSLVPAFTLITSTRMAIGKAVLFSVDVAINQDLKALFFQKWINVNYMFFWFQFNEKELASIGSGSTVTGISLSELKKFPIRIASEISEQTAIAAILSDMDADITALENQLAKARQIKQGMMQELLTGRIRLV